MKAEHAKHLAVPHYEDLTLEKIWNHLGNYPNIKIYFPIEREVRRLPKQFIINLAYSCIGQDFATWVKNIVDERNKRLALNRDMLIEMDPDVFAAFKRSTAVSSKYIFLYLLEYSISYTIILLHSIKRNWCTTS